MDELRDYSIVVGGHEDSSNNHKKNTIWRKLKKFLPGTKPYRKSCYDLNIHKIYLGDGNNAVVERKEYGKLTENI